MNNLLRKWTEAFRRALRLPDIEQELSCLRGQLAEQEVRISATQALVVDQQYLLLERLDTLQKDLDRVAMFKDQDSSGEIDTACQQETSVG